MSPASKLPEKTNKLEPTKTKWNQWSPLSALTTKNEKRKTLDDSALESNEVKVVSLRSHDFTGLGFNIFGNMRDGIYIKDVLHHGPASESGKLNPGDRITGVTISFEHMVYEDALTILSYASPYEVIVEAKRCKTPMQSPAQSAQPGHPLFRSSSSADVLQIGKSSKKRLFQPDDYPESNSSTYSSLQKTRSNATTLERKEERPKKPANKPQLNPEQLKTQLEQRIIEDHQQNLKIKNEKLNLEMQMPVKAEGETQKTDNKYQKFGIKVLPEQKDQQKSPKIAELSQNENNINLERHLDHIQTIQKMAVDEIDISKSPPEIKKREKTSKPEKQPEIEDKESSPPPPFERQNSLNGSGIKRDKNGIPQEIPNHMFNAAVAARRNRRNEEKSIEKEPDLKSPKKLKGKAPAPPPEPKVNDNKEPIINKPNFTFDEIQTAEETEDKHKLWQKEEIAEKNDEDALLVVKTENKDYNSDSDIETDNHSSVNTIELNASDITIHQTEEEEKLSRKTASTGDLTTIHKTRKTSTGTLERAQSLDITDAGIPTLSKKRKGAKLEEMFDSKTSSDENLYGKALINKEPRLSLILDGLSTFQRSRLKKSTEWGNLEDAILNFSKDDGSTESLNDSTRKFDFGEKSPEFDALVNKINEIKNETSQEIERNEKELQENVKEMRKGFEDFERVINESKQSLNEVDVDKKVKNQIWPPLDTETKKLNDDEYLKDLESKQNQDIVELEEQIRKSEMNLNKIEDCKKSIQIDEDKHLTNVEDLDEISKSEEILFRNTLDFTKGFIFAEKAAYEYEDIYIPVRDDTNVSDDIKVSRHTLDKLKPNAANENTKNISNITITDKSNDNDNINTFNIEFNSKNIPNIETSLKPVITNQKTELYKSSKSPNELPKGDQFEYGKIVTTPDLIKNVTIAEAIHNLNNEVTIEGPSSLSLEINENISQAKKMPLGINCEKMSNGTIKETSTEQSNKAVDVSKSKNSSLSKSTSNLTYITEIQVLTPNRHAKSNSNISEVEIVPSIDNTSRNLDNEFEKYVKNFETNIRSFETNIKTFDTTIQDVNKVEQPKAKSMEKLTDPEKELHKIQEIAEEQLKKLPEMRFTTSSYEGNKGIQEKRQSHIELLRSNFEKTDKSPPKSLKMEIGATKSRIPIATTTKTPPTSPERRDSRNLEIENQKEIIEMMSSNINSPPHITSSFKYQPKISNKNVTVTSIRSNSKIPSGLPTYSNRPPVPPRRTESSHDEIQISTNGGSESSFKQWVFNPTENSVTNIVVTQNKNENKS